MTAVGQMLPNLALMAFSLAFSFGKAAPAFADVSRTPVEPSPSTAPALHLMNNDEFTLFLKRFDSDALRWKGHLGQVNLQSINLSQKEHDELERSYSLCLRSLDNAREEVQRLSEKQTLKLDFLLLVDLHDLARNLDQLNRDLINATGGRTAPSQRTLGYARAVLVTDEALAPYVTEFQHHLLAFAGVMDAAVDQADPSPAQPEN